MAFRDNSLFLMKNMETSHMRACQGKLLLFERLRLFTDLSDAFALHCFTQMLDGNEATCKVLRITVSKNFS